MNRVNLSVSRFLFFKNFCKNRVYYSDDSKVTHEMDKLTDFFKKADKAIEDSKLNLNEDKTEQECKEAEVTHFTDTVVHMDSSSGVCMYNG